MKMSRNAKNAFMTTMPDTMYTNNVKVTVNVPRLFKMIGICDRPENLMMYKYAPEPPNASKLKQAFRFEYFGELPLANASPALMMPRDKIKNKTSSMLSR